MFMRNYVYVHVELCVLNCGSTYYIYTDLLKFDLQIL
jgi:hypothetical protein